MFEVRGIMLHFLILVLLSANYAKAADVIRVDLLHIDVGTTVSMAEVKRITLPPGQLAFVHKHPCPVLGTVLKGEIVFKSRNGRRKILKPGEAFYEAPDEIITNFDNNSKEDAAEFIAIYLRNDSHKELIIPIN